MKVAFVFPGQGAQYAGMGRDISEKFSEARAAFAEADTALEFRISRLCFEGPEEKLKLTENTQPAIVTVSIAMFRVLEGKGVRPDFVAGHSLGEYSALVAAGAMKLGEAARLVRNRGRYMQEAVPVGEGAMAAIVGLDLPVVQSICDRAAEGQIVSPANLNSPGQIVIAGNRNAVERRACERSPGKDGGFTEGQRPLSLRLVEARRGKAVGGSGSVRLHRTSTPARHQCRCSSDPNRRRSA